jgi:cation diffusion facilitator family transporter
VSAEHQNIRIQRWVLIVGIILFAIKVAAWYITNSVAIFTDAMEGVVNVFSAAIGLYSLSLAAKPRDDNHPYGHGKIEFLSAALEGVAITVAGSIIIWEAISRLIAPQEIEQLPLGIILVGFAGGINGLLGWLAVRIGRRNHSIALESSGRHLLSDAYSTAGLLLGLALLLITGYLWLDVGIASVFGVIIIITGLRILRRSIAGIMDEADTRLLQNLIRLLQDERRENWVDIHNLRIIKFGSVLHIDCHLTLPWYFTVKEAHAEVELLSEVVRKKFGRRVEFFIHADGCKPLACSICSKEQCPERKAAFEKSITWTLENSIANAEHNGQLTTATEK